MKLPKNLIWVVLICIIALIAYAVGKQGQTVKKLSVNSEGIAIEFDQLKNIPEKELGKRQNELEQKLEEIQGKFQNSSQESNIPDGQSEFNLNGRWQSNHGNYYNISQFGNAITIQEVSPIYGITAIGQGVLDKQTIQINYVTTLYTQGWGTLLVYDDGDRMDAAFTDSSTGMTTNALLYR